MFCLLSETPDYTHYIFLAFGAVMVVSVIIGLFRVVRSSGGKSSGGDRGKSSWERQADALAESHSAEELYEMANERKDDVFLSRELIKRAAEKGHAQAQMEAGLAVQYDDASVAVEWYKKAAAQGVDEAYERLGDIYRYGFDIGETKIEKNPDEAVKWYLPLAEKGNVEIQKRVALYYALEKKDAEQEIKWLLAAAEQGDEEAINSLCLAYGAQGDEENEIFWKKKLAAKGDASAIYELGMAYEFADEPDMQEAVKWYEQAAEAGYSNAKVRLGILYLEGRGKEKDVKKALKIFEEQAAEGNGWAKYNLGKCYLEGNGVLKDAYKAVEYFSASDITPAHYELALCYLDGIGVEKDKVKAFELLKSEEDAFDGDIKYKLGECYFFGTGVEKNREKARELWRKAAEWDSEEAIAALEMHFGEKTEG